MRKEFDGMKYCHALNLVGNTFKKKRNYEEALLDFIHLPNTVTISVARDKDRDSLGKCGFILTGDLLEAYDMDCLSKVINGTRRSKRKQCSLAEWNTAFFYTEGFLTNFQIESIYWRLETRKEECPIYIHNICKEHGFNLIVVPYSIKSKDEIYIYDSQELN